MESCTVIWQQKTSGCRLSTPNLEIASLKGTFPRVLKSWAINYWNYHVKNVNEGQNYKKKKKNQQLT